jgi:SAM-dependent methyltransferase
VPKLEYVGPELELFALAKEWKSYLLQVIVPHLGPEVLEVGAGFGATTEFLCRRSARWVCLEPDPNLASRLANRVRSNELPPCCEVVSGTLDDLDPRLRFDSVLYVDVLEHIENDAQEAADAARRLRPFGRLIVLAPAHQWLYSRFDATIGHHRRYSKGSLASLMPPHLLLVELLYLDAAGLLASVANRLALRQGTPTRGQILFWDRALVRLSRRLDPLVGHRLGKSLLGVWEQR